MSKVYLEDSTLTSIADAIRAKTGESGTITPANMATEIESISGGGDPVIESKTITANGIYTAPEGIDGYSPITVNVEGGLDLSNVYKNYLFYGGRFLDKIGDEDIVIPSNRSLGTGDGIFNNINNPGRNIPNIHITGSTNFGDWYSNRDYYFSGKDWQNIPNIIFDNDATWTISSTATLPNIWYFPDKYLDTLPTIVTDFIIFWFLKAVGNPALVMPGNSTTGSGHSLFTCYVKDASDFFERYRYPDNQVQHSNYGIQSYYSTVLLKNRNCSDIRNITSFPYNMFFPLQHLNGIYNLQIVGKNTPATTNMFQTTSSSLAYCALAGTNGNLWKDFMFEMIDENTPYTAMWQNQIIIIGGTGNYSVGAMDIDEHNPYNIPQVTTDAKYELYKDQIYACMTHLEYARYNHDSAVRTIKSLPDCSAYLESSGGVTNKIRFYKPTQGSATDGGAINTLTEAEIAVATDKGWTVVFN